MIEYNLDYIYIPLYVHSAFVYVFSYATYRFTWTFQIGRSLALYVDMSNWQGGCSGSAWFRDPSDITMPTVSLDRQDSKE